MHIVKDMGWMEKPLMVPSQKTMLLNIKSLSNLIQDKKVGIYTGAGISAKVVPTMDQLMEGLNFGQKMHNPYQFKPTKKMIENLNQFKNACLHGEPTQAHLAIRNICKKKNWGLLTENLDWLHQRSGVMPINHTQKDWLKSQVTPDDLKKIEAVLTIGLRTDESGFLGWYKRHNPKGIIIAINLIQPNYLGDQDYLIRGDAQEICPQLNHYLKGENHV